MKANEFVKTHGIKSAQDIVKYYGNHTHITDDARMFITEEFYKKTSADYVDDLNSMVRMVDLKRIVESHELVEVEGGIDEVKHTFSFASKHGANELTEYGTRLKQAIADMESCK